jgi:N utilization substance protein B
MLNRRLLRTKVVHALYASRLAYDSNLLLAEDYLAEVFAPDLNSMEVQDKPKLEASRKDAVSLLGELERGGSASNSVYNEQIRVAAQRAYEQFLTANKKEQKRQLTQIIDETQQIYRRFIAVVQLIVELGNLANQDRQKPLRVIENSFPRAGGLDTNILWMALSSSKELEVEVARQGVGWANELAFVRKIYKESLKQDEQYTNYCQTPQHSVEEEHELLQHILRKLIFKNETFVEYMEQQDRYWGIHSELIRGLAIKYLKAVYAQPSAFSFPKFTDDWEDDRFFMEELFGQTIRNERQFDNYLKDQLQHWDIDRVSLVDLVVLKAALAELIYFPGIPAKVTINEFIEIAKLYSTPNSGKFVNGILDVLSVKLQKEGIIRKSGRGLLDNK